MSTDVPGPNPQGPVTHTVQVPQNAPLRVTLEQPTSFWGRNMRRLLWVALGFSVLANINMASMYKSYFSSGEGIEEKWHSRSKTAQNKIAIITVEGAIMGSEGYVKKQMECVREDNDVKAIVLRVDSPGGTVTASDYIYHHLKKLVKEKNIPLVVSMGSVAASGGYYVSMAAGDKEKVIYAEPTTWTGSIGVIIPHYNVSGLLEKWDVADDSVASGRYKQMGSPTRKLDPKQQEEEHALLKGLVDDSFIGFKDIVLQSRAPLRENQALQDIVFTGQIFTAKQAKQNGLVDELGFIEDAIDRAIELSGVHKDDVRVVKFKQPETLAALLGASSRAPGASLDLSQLLDMTAPRAYYLCTWLPGVAMSPQMRN